VVGGSAVDMLEDEQHSLGVLEPVPAILYLPDEGVV
jgi:hypothetical protein